MRISGHNVLPYPVEQVWDALLDPAVLVRTIPGCERLETTAENTYAMTVTAGVAAIRGTYDGTCALSDLAEHESLVMRLAGAGAPGTIDATVNVAFSAPTGAETTISYDADAVVGGMVGGVGQRMLGSVSKRMAGEFFDNVGAAIAGTPGPAAASAGSAGSAASAGSAGSAASAGSAGSAASAGSAGAAGAPLGQPAPSAEGSGVGQVFTAPPRARSSQQEFVKGVAVGAALVLLGVVAGGSFGRRRR